MAQGTKKRGRTLIYLALLLIIVFLLAAFLLRNQILGATTVQQPQTVVPTTPPVETVSILVAAQRISRGSMISEDVLTTIPYPKKEADAAQGTFYTDMKDVVGKMAKIDIDPRVPITSSMVVTSIEGSFASFEIPKGMVAVSIPISRLSSVSYAPQAGDHVNVIASLLFVDLDTEFQTILPNGVAPVTGPGAATEGGPTNITAQIGSGQGTALGRAQNEPTLQQPVYVVPSESQRGRLVSQTLVQDAVVLYVGTFPLHPTEVGATSGLEPTPTPTPEPGAAAAPPAENPDVITIIVTPQEAVSINYMLFSGAQLNLALRGAGDDQRVQTEAVTLQYLMDSYGIPLPAKLPYGVQPKLEILSPIVLPNDRVAVTPQ